MSDVGHLIDFVRSIRRSLARVRAPRPRGAESVDHRALHSALAAVGGGEGIKVLELAPQFRIYVDMLSRVDPDRLDRSEALAYWINLYNAGALILTGDALRDGMDSVLRIPRGFQRPFVTVADENLSLDDVEHAKVRRFGDPRIHTALICGSVSCPTLRGEPYTGTDLSAQLDDQLSHFLVGGGCDIDGDVVRLSRLFRWFGGDFVHPARMPTLRPVSPRSVLLALVPWLSPEVVESLGSRKPRVEFQPYDWGLRCVVR